MAEREELELLDLEDDAELPELPDDNPLEAARPRRPWLLFGIAAVVIALATYIIIRVVGHAPEDTVDISIEVPQAAVENANGMAPLIVPEDTTGAPVRIVSDRADVKFNPNAESSAPKVEAPKPRPAAKSEPAPKPAAKAPVSKPVSSAVTTGWSVQVGSYSTRDGANAAQRRLQTNHRSLFADRQFVVLAAVLPNGSTTYRLRVTGFASSADANGFCRNAKSDGLDCYVAK